MAIHTTGDRFARLVLAAAALATFARPVTAGGLTSRANVVVLTGLPGDVESERAYEGDLRRLLTALDRAQARPQRVLVLADAPERVSLPAGLAGEAKAGSRDGFLRAAHDLAATPGPLVVIAWGHGGLMGTKPVFHVRGPRLTVDDFTAFAQAAGDRPAHFVLYFRGSGSFAQALAGPRREILSSENEVAFKSDPIGLPLLLRVLQGEPELSFDALADRVGRATAIWYEEQHLARTEEPTLRSAGRVRLLAARPEAEPADSEGPSAENARRAPPPPPSGGSLPAEAWKDLRPVDPARFPGSAAVVLRRQTSYTLGDSPALSQEVDEFVQILTEEGESRADIDVAYSPPEERVSFLDCEIRRPDGSLERLDPDAIREGATSGPLPEYPAQARRAFSLPGAAPGAILRVHYRSEWKHFPLPHIFQSVPLAADIPILEAQLEVHVATATVLHTAFRATAPQTPAISESPHGRTYLWRFRDLPAVPNEAMAPPGLTPELLLSTFPDWASFAGWYRRLIQLADQVTPEIETQAQSLVRGKTSDLDKVKALYEYVTRFRYVAVPLGVNSHRPHAASRVLGNRYGDCKDKANLFNTLLRSQGISADLVLVPRFSEAEEATPGLGFNHAISRVRVGNEWLFLDTTDPFARFGLLPPGDPGRNVLVVDSQARGLTRLPTPAPDAHGLTLRGRIAVGAEAEGSPTELEVSAQGYADYALRLAARGIGPQATTQALLAEVLRPAAGAFALREQSHTAVTALDTDFVWRARGNSSGFLSTLSGAESLLRAPFWIPQEWEAVLAPRRTPLFLNQGYPLRLEQTLELELPPGSRTIALPVVRSSETAPLRFRLDWEGAGESRVRARLRLELTSGELSLAETHLFQAQARSLLEALAQGARVAGRVEDSVTQR